MPDRVATSAVDRAFDLLTIAVDADGPLTLADAAAQARIPKPTAHRIMRTLVARGLLTQEEDRTYRVGSKLYGLAGKTLAQMEYVREAQPGLRWLQSVTPETIHFAVLTGEQAVFVAKLESRTPYRMASTVGMSLAMHCTSIGKAILAFMPAERRAPYLAPERLVRHTANTITKPAALEEELELIRTRGFSIDDAENEDNIRCTGAPVFDAQATVIGGIGVASTSFHLSHEAALALAPATMYAGRLVSLALGAPPESLPAAYGGLVDAPHVSA
jgi:DNA-binding IclR family transcriptional regulator